MSESPGTERCGSCVTHDKLNKIFLKDHVKEIKKNLFAFVVVFFLGVFGVLIYFHDKGPVLLVAIIWVFAVAVFFLGMASFMYILQKQKSRTWFFLFSDEKGLHLHDEDRVVRGQFDGQYYQSDGTPIKGPIFRIFVNKENKFVCVYMSNSTGEKIQSARWHIQVNFGKLLDSMSIGMYLKNEVRFNLSHYGVGLDEGVRGLSYDHMIYIATSLVSIDHVVPRIQKSTDLLAYYQFMRAALSRLNTMLASDRNLKRSPVGGYVRDVIQTILEFSWNKSSVFTEILTRTDFTANDHNRLNELRQELVRLYELELPEYKRPEAQAG